MEKTWKNQSVDLALLTTRIGDFFKEKDFEAIKGKTATGYQILAEDSPYFKLQTYVSVIIEGEPNDFIVKLQIGEKEEKKRRFNPSALLMSLLGGGYFLSRELRADEAWLKLKKEFWRHVDSVVAASTFSAGTQS